MEHSSNHFVTKGNHRQCCAPRREARVATIFPPAIPLSLSISPDIVLVGIAGAVLVGAGILQRSLGDVMKEEAQLPPAAGAAGRRQSQRSKRFLKRNTPPRRPF